MILCKNLETHYQSDIKLPVFPQTQMANGDIRYKTMLQVRTKNQYSERG